MGNLVLYEMAGSPLRGGSGNDIYVPCPAPLDMIEAFAKSRLKGMAEDLSFTKQKNTVLQGLFQGPI